MSNPTTASIKDQNKNEASSMFKRNVRKFMNNKLALSFIGLGVADSTPTWGNILNAAKSVSVVTNQWWIWLFPGLAISLFVLAINFLGDGLRDVLDAKQQ